jgi:hypothetical protein
MEAEITFARKAESLAQARISCSRVLQWLKIFGGLQRFLIGNRSGIRPIQCSKLLKTDHGYIQPIIFCISSGRRAVGIAAGLGAFF